MRQMPESKCEKCETVHAWSNLVLNLTFICQYCGHVNKYSKSDIQPDKINFDGIHSKPHINQYNIRDFLMPKIAFIPEETAFIPEGTPLHDNVMKQKEHDKTNYSFNVTCEEIVHFPTIAEDLSADNYCLHVRTEGVENPLINRLLLHHSIAHKAKILGILPPFDCREVSSGFYYMDISSADNEFKALKDCFEWMKKVRKASFKGTVVTRINNKPITVKVTNRSRRN